MERQCENALLHASSLQKSTQVAVSTESCGMIGNTTKTENDHIYIVEKVLKHRMMNGKKFARIKWKGFPYRESTWEPVESIFKMDETVKPAKKCAEVKVVRGKTRRGNAKHRDRFKNELTNCVRVTAAESQRSNLVETPEQTSHGTKPTGTGTGTDIVGNPQTESCANIPDFHPESYACTEISTDQYTVDFLDVEETVFEVEISTEAPATMKVDDWSANDVRDFFVSRAFPHLAAVLYNDHVDGVTLLGYDHVDLALRAGVRGSQAVKLSRLICRMRNGVVEY